MEGPHALVGVSENQKASHGSFLVELCSQLPALEVKKLLCGDQVRRISADGTIRTQY